MQLAEMKLGISVNFIEAVILNNMHNTKQMWLETIIYNSVYVYNN